MAESRLIVWSEEVQMDIEEVAEFYDLRNGSPIYSQYLILEFREAVKKVALFPLIGARTEYPHIRYVIVESYYSLFYHFNDSAIVVLWLWDNRQDPEKLQYHYNTIEPSCLNEPPAKYNE